MTLMEWLSSSPNVVDLKPVRVTIKGTTYEGASYRDSDQHERLILGGELPACYRRSTRIAFVINGDDWYIVAYQNAASRADHARRFPSFAANMPPQPETPWFILCAWPTRTPDGRPSSIDDYEPRPYTRVSVTRED